MVISKILFLFALSMLNNTLINADNKYREKVCAPLCLKTGERELVENTEKKETHRREIEGVILALSAIVLLTSLASFNPHDAENLATGRAVANLIGPFGAWLAKHLRGAFGLAAFIIPACLALLAWGMMKQGGLGQLKEKLIALVYLAVVLSPLLGFFFHAVHPENAGGWMGMLLANFSRQLFGVFGTTLLVLGLNLLGLILPGIFSLSGFMRGIRRMLPLIIGRCRRIIVRLRERRVPRNSIEEAIEKRKKGRLPWVTKKKIVLYGTHYSRPDTAADGAVKLISMQNPVYDGAGGDGYAYHHYREADRSLFNSVGAAKDDDNAGCTVPLLSQSDSEWDRWMSSQPVRDALSAVSLKEISVSPRQITELKEDTRAVLNEDSDEEIAQQEKAIYSLDDSIEEDAGDDAIAVIDDEADVAAESGEMPHVFEKISMAKEYALPVKYLISTQSADSETFQSEIRRNSDLLVNTLRDFGIESRVVKVNRGPVITLYEMQIAPGIKVNRIVALADDIAMALAASRVRVVAPIPGKSAIGVEVPNLNREMVTLGDIIKAPEYALIPGRLKVALGKDILGNPVTLDLKKLPHLLIAGATGSGKSVLVNTIITSLVYNYDPNHVRFILVDPKMVELQLYNGLPHLLTPVITEPHVAPRALKWATIEMERRYRLLSAMNTRDIDRYNERAEKTPGCEKLPYIVIIMDELADLMMVAAKEIEGFITRIAQKARAVGIHLVLATQRPSVDVITGIIKANFPARIAFQVAQKTDSRTIIDQNGAEKLLGKGDMLYQSPMSSFPIRIQGAFISEDEVISIVQHLRRLARPNYIDIEEELFEAEDDEDFSGEEDELFQEALRIVAETKKASASYLQRRLSIGYNRAARMIELMEEKGLIGPQQGSKPREVYL